MSGYSKNLINLVGAVETLNRMLVGAYLDQLSAHSIQVSLRFINDKIIQDMSAFVDVVLSCDAFVAFKEGELPDTSSEDDFFLRRATFLAGVHGLIGKSISSVNLKSDGSLAIHIDSSSIHLHLSNHDQDDDDWVWKVESEVTIDHPRPGTKVLSCVPEEGSVDFFASEA